jgi:hypothetical protein
MVLTIFSAAILGALPPFAQSKREIQAIICSDELYKRLGSSHPILGITRNEKGRYEISNGRHSLIVRVEYLPRNDRLVGPTPFEIHFEE